MAGILALGFDLAQSVTTQAIERTNLLLIGLQLDGMQGRDHFPAQQLNGARDIPVRHRPSPLAMPGAPIAGAPVG
jgi:hypothetical protein